MSGKTGLGLPYCGISAIAITCALWGSLLYCRGNRITLRTLALSKEPYAITAETDIGGYPDITLLKTKTSTESFVRRTEEMALDDEAFTFLAPWLIGAGLILTLLAAAISKNWRGFMHIWSAIMVPTAPFIALLSYPLPFLYTARSLFHNGNAIGQHNYIQYGADPTGYKTRHTPELFDYIAAFQQNVSHHAEGGEAGSAMDWCWNPEAHD